MVAVLGDAQDAVDVGFDAVDLVVGCADDQLETESLPGGHRGPAKAASDLMKPSSRMAGA